MKRIKQRQFYLCESIFNLVTRNNIVWKLALGYCLCYCKTFLLVPDSAECIKVFTEECGSTLLVPPKIKYYRSNENHQYKRTLLSMTDSVCTQLILVNSRNFLEILCIYCTNWLRVTSCQEQIDRLLVVMYHENIHELLSLRFLNLNLECENIKMGRRTSIFFFHEAMFLIGIMQSDNKVVSIDAVFFKKQLLKSYAWSKNITLTVK